jgi:membrane-bound lytic murein transglycosylase MltF
MQDNIRPLVIFLLAVGLVLLMMLGGPRDETPSEQPSIAETPAPVEQPQIKAPEQSREILDLGAMRKRKQIRALVTYSRTDFFFYKGRAKGVQVEFLLAYEKFLNRDIKRPENKIHISFLPVPFDQLIPALNEGRGDIAAAFLTITPQRQKQVDFATGGRFKVSELVVSNKGKVKLERLEDLSGKRVYVLSNSSYVQHLEQLNSTFSAQGLAPVEIVQADSELLSEDILELVDSGVVDITVVDDYKARLWQQLLPNLQVHEDLKVSRNNLIGWAIRNNSPELSKSLNAFSVKVRKGSLLGNMLFRRYYRDTQWIKNPTSKQELKKLTESIELFKKYSNQYDFDYLALLAQAYQESGLEHSKRSHHGAVGIMQMLPSTARDSHVSIRNITRLENNIHAGTKYLAFLRDRYFSDPALTPENRQAFTWAAYNAGPANVIKMRNKAKVMGLDPNVWFSNVEIAASKLIGRETVQYVAHIYKYYIAYKLASDLHNGDPLFISGAAAKFRG